MNDDPTLYETCKDTSSTYDEDICSTCLRKNSGAIKITDLDYDGRTFLEKLEACVFPKLEVHRENVPRICRVCITSLNLSFKFKKTATDSLRTLKYISEKNVEYDDEEIDIKMESDFPNDNELDNSELDNAVLVLTKLTNGETSRNIIELNCRECSLTFREQSEYEEHMVKSHNKKLVCELCGKPFKTYSRLKEHVASHTREKNYNCTNCNKAFSRMSSLKRHMTTHYAPPGQKSKKTPFLCTICGKNFPFSNGATRHMRIHLGIKTHECQICHKQFNQSTHLQVHMRTHSGEKPYICEICGDCFSLKAGLHKHMKTKHKQEDKLDNTQNNVFFT
ncbi:zinc finger protein 567-like [Coccinella septempunctata]|uniref:zinc finger protein 567-like n=1 Tax=Coccinella septempunctata TaxID=41139 RepID=UPI001D09598E|nr:zinc finger protein 567-like [Coccinella septempunctata]